jgi:hypothetical protein
MPDSNAATRRAHDLDRWQREAEQRVWRRAYASISSHRITYRENNNM